MDLLPIHRAILSVTDKTGLVEFAKFLVDNGVELVSTGGTMKCLKEGGLPVKAVSDVTGFPEILGGRVNLYNFAGAVSRHLSLEQAVEEIDIGGPCMLRAAAKNYHSVLVVPGVEWYEPAMEDLKEHNMCSSLEFRQLMASRTFDATSRYDALITSYIRP